MTCSSVPKPIQAKSNLKVEVIEDISFDLKGKKQKKHGILPSARKSTSRGVNSEKEVQKPTARKSSSRVTNFDFTALPLPKIKTCFVKMIRCKPGDEVIVKSPVKEASKSSEYVDPISTMMMDFENNINDSDKDSNVSNN